jgi:hypothetical protein
MAEIIRYDAATADWFLSRCDVQTTVCKCDACGLYYKPSLGHKCKVRKKGE